MPARKPTPGDLAVRPLNSRNDAQISSSGAAMFANRGQRKVAPPRDAGFRSLPSFFVIGPPRTGTSWLHEILRQCSWLSNPTKETRFFDKHFHRGLAWYASHYREATAGRRIGEIAPTYFASEEARERIARLIPHAKVVCTFRNPVDRVLSLYRLKRAYGLIPWSFDEALVRDPELMESSRYAFHLKAWQNTLGTAQVLPTVYEDLRSGPQYYLDAVTDFVDVPRIRLGPSQINRVLTSEGMTEPRSYYLTRAAQQLADWSRALRLDAVIAEAKKRGVLKLFVGGGPAFPQLSFSERLRLCELFRPEVEELEAALNRDFSAWKYPRDYEPGAQPVTEIVTAARRRPLVALSPTPPAIERPVKPAVDAIPLRLPEL
jgi:Sulfotransferase domain